MNKQESKKIDDIWETNSLNDVKFNSNFDYSKQYYIEVLPDNFDINKKYNLIIAFHGHGSDRWQFPTEKRDECRAFRYISRKYKMIAISPDYRAKTSWMGPTAELDTLQIINKLKEEYKIDKVFLIGGSMGGTSALTFASLHPNIIDGVMAMNSLANHLEYKNFQNEISESFGENLLSEKEKRSAELNFEKLTMPIAFTTGGKDKSVPCASVHRLFNKLNKLNSKVLLIHRDEVEHETNFEDAVKALEFMYKNVVY